MKVPAAWQGVEGHYSLGLGIDQEAAVHISAETNGQPKFLCDVTFFRLGDAVTARATAAHRSTSSPRTTRAR